MKELIAGFPNQLEEAIAIGEKFSLSIGERDLSQVIISGLGGSGIGGNIVSSMVEKEMQIPFLVNKNYFLPNFTNRDTLVIISSYSGNTEETLNAFKIAFTKGATIVAISSNGEVGQLCDKHDIDLVTVPGGMPPRAALGFSLVQQLFILAQLKLINHGPLDDLKRAVGLLRNEQDEIRALSKSLAGEIYKTIPVIYTTTEFEPVAVRYRQQLNENAKMLAWHNIIPEMNHNEIVGWSRDYGNLSALFLRHGREFERNKHRLKITQDIMAKYVAIHEVQAKGDSIIEQMLYLIHFGDWLSYYLAEAKGADAMEITAIDRLKKGLREI